MTDRRPIPTRSSRSIPRPRTRSSRPPTGGSPRNTTRTSRGPRRRGPDGRDQRRVGAPARSRARAPPTIAIGGSRRPAERRAQPLRAAGGSSGSPAAGGSAGVGRGRRSPRDHDPAAAAPARDGLGGLDERPLHDGQRLRPEPDAGSGGPRCRGAAAGRSVGERPELRAVRRLVAGRGRPAGHRLPRVARPHGRSAGSTARRSMRSSARRAADGPWPRTRTSGAACSGAARPSAAPRRTSSPRPIGGPPRPQSFPGRAG